MKQWYDMSNIEFILNDLIGIISVIALFNIGIYIGRKFGTFTKFICKILNKLEKKLKGE